MFAATAVVLAAIGVVGVTANAIAATRALTPFLFGVSAADPPTYAMVLAMIVVVAATAAWVPARRVTRVDLMRVLGVE